MGEILILSIALNGKSGTTQSSGIYISTNEGIQCITTELVKKSGILEENLSRE